MKRFYILILVVFPSLTYGESFMEWMRSYGLREYIHDVDGDFDNDGIPNIIEYALNENPILTSRFYTSANIVSDQLTISHSNKADIKDTEIKYLWTKDMLSFYQSGESSEDGTVVVLSESLANGRKDITAEIIAGSADSIFVKYIVDHAAILSWGSGRDLGGALFSNATSISLVDDSLNPLSGPIQIDYDPNGIWGYASIDQQVMEIEFLGTPMILINTEGGSQGLISSTRWTPIETGSSLHPLPINDFKITIDDDLSTIIDWSNQYDLNRVELTRTGGVGSQGYAIYVVPSTIIGPGDTPNPNEDNTFFWENVPEGVCSSCFFLPFGKTIAVKNNYMFPDTKWVDESAEKWGGFLYKDPNNVFPLTFGSGGRIKVSAGLYPTTNMKDVDLYFLIGKDDFPNIEPYYVTEQLTLTGNGTGTTDFEIIIPPQFEKEFSAIAMYIVQRDAPVRIESIEFVSSDIVQPEPDPNPEPDPDPNPEPDPDPNPEPEPDPNPEPEPLDSAIINLYGEFLEKISYSYDKIIDLYELYPNMYLEIYDMETRVKNIYKVIDNVPDLYVQHFGYFDYIKLANTIKKAKFKIDDLINSVVSLSPPQYAWLLPYQEFFGDWEIYDSRFPKYKFFQGDGTTYNFEIVLSDLNDSTDFASQTIDLITQKITNYNYNLQFSDRPYAIDTSNLNSEINYDTTTENMLHENWFD
jgi:hypothetical protein